MESNRIKERRDYQRLILNYLRDNNKFLERDSNIHYDANLAMDKELLMKFLWATQKEKLEFLQTKSSYKSDFEGQIISNINRYIYDYNLIDALTNGVEMDGQKLDLMYTKPAMSYNADLNEKYDNNIFSVMEEVNHKEDERIDLVIFLNGIAIFAIELKCNLSGQNYKDAISQFMFERDPKTRLLEFKRGVLVSFAMDLEEVWMTTHLCRRDTFFRPFNKGFNKGAGNPPTENNDGIRVSYMWEDILTKDSILFLIDKFIFIEYEKKKDEKTGKTKIQENLIFPRYHQLNAVKRLIEDMKINHTSRNYLIEHSAGSGKTNTIAWLSHLLKSLHDNDVNIFDTIIIMTDRIVVDRQLQDAVSDKHFKAPAGEVVVLDDDSTSDDLRRALNGNTKIIVTTIHKFSYITDSTKALKNKKFAVIIDEAHSSTSGAMMEAVTTTLTKEDESEEKTTYDLLVDEINSAGKQDNISIIAFTATPKGTTLQLFGEENGEAFSLYSMKQAIQEGYILDVLQNYTTYETYFEVNKKIQEDPLLKERTAKRKIAHMINTDDTNLKQKLEIMLDHFTSKIQYMLDGQAKAMVVTSSREAAVKYKNIFDELIKEKQYTNIEALVAFSGKIKVNGIEYSEPKMNGISEAKLAEAFDTNEYQVLIVANKYQTGFDQKKLVAMYVDKKLRGISAVQTLSRLNRTCKGKDSTFILDFKNSYDDIINAFKPYYEETILTNRLNPNDIYKLDKKLWEYGFLNKEDIDKFVGIIYQEKLTDKDKEKVIAFVSNAYNKIQDFDENIINEIRTCIRSFIRLYSFIIQASDFEDVRLHKQYVFLKYLLKELIGINRSISMVLKDKISITNFVQNKTGEIKKSGVTSDPNVKLPSAEPGVIIPEAEEELSKIIDDINKKYSKHFDKDFSIKAILQIKDIMLQSEDLKQAAKVNSQQNFNFKLQDILQELLFAGLKTNKELYKAILKDESTKQALLKMLSDDVYKKLRNDD